MALYDVGQKYKNLQQRMIDGDGYTIDSETGEALTQEQADHIVQQEIMGLMDDQAEGAEVAVKMIRELEALNDAAKAETDRIAELIKSRERRIQYAKNGMRESMEATDIKRIETSVGNVTLAKGSLKTLIKDEAALIELSLEDGFEGCVKVEVVRKPVLKEVAALIKEGKISEDVATQERGENSIRIK